MRSSSIPELLEGMSNWDKDKRFMAASDLLHEMLQGGVQMGDVATQKKICQAFLKQLEDSSIEVQGNAVKCLSKLSCKFADPQLGEAMSKLADLVLEGNSQLRDIYAACLKGFLIELPRGQSRVVSQDLLPKMISGVNSADVGVKEGKGGEEEEERRKRKAGYECLDILCEVLSRFGKGHRNWASESERLQKFLLSTLKKLPERPVLRKRACACLAALAESCDSHQLDALLGVLLAEVEGKGERMEDIRVGKGNLKEKEVFVQCIGSVSRAVGHRMDIHACRVGELFLEMAEANTSPHLDGGMDEGAERDDELVELCLQGLESLVRGCGESEFMSLLLPKHQEPLAQLITFDPNFYSGGCGSEEDPFSDYGEDSDYEGLDSEDDDTSWKVRRSALGLVASLGLAAPALAFPAFSSPLIDRFGDREEGVQLAVLSTYGSFFKQLHSVRPEERSPLLSTIPSAIQALSKKTFTGGKKPRASLAALEVLKHMSEACPAEMVNFLPAIKEKVVSPLLGRSLGLSDLTLQNLRLSWVEMVEVLSLAPEAGTVIRGIGKELLDSLTMSKANAKLRAKAIKCFSELILRLRSPNETSFEFYSESVVLMEEVGILMEASDVDQDLKEASLLGWSRGGAVLGDLPGMEGVMLRCMKGLGLRLANHLSRASALRAIVEFCSSSHQRPQDVFHKFLPELILTVSGFLEQHQRVLRRQSLECLLALRKRFPEEKAMEQNLHTLLPVLKDNDFVLADLGLQVLSLSISSPPSPELAPPLLSALLEFARCPKIQGSALNSLLSALSSVQRVLPPPQRDELFREMVSLAFLKEKMEEEQAEMSISNLSKCVAALLRGVEETLLKETVAVFLKRAKEGMPDLLEWELSILAVGEVGRGWDLLLLASPTEAGVLLELLEGPEVDGRIKKAASVALGNATRSSKTLLTEVVNAVSKSHKGEGDSRTRYLLLSALRTAISDSQHVDGSLLSSVSQGLKASLEVEAREASDDSSDGLVMLLSECLGRLCPFPELGLTSYVQRLLEDENPLLSVAGVNAVRVLVEEGGELGQVSPLVDRVVLCLSSNDIKVRKSCYLPLSALSRSPAAAVLKEHCGVLLKSIERDSELRKELIREVNLGPFVHKVDDGLPLRKAAVSTLSSLLPLFPKEIGRKPEVFNVILKRSLALEEQEDVQLLACQVLMRASESVPYSCSRFASELYEPLKALLGKLLHQASSTGAPNRPGQGTQRKAGDSLKMVARAAVSLQKVVPDDPEGSKFAEYVRQTLLEPVFAQMGDLTQQGA